MASKYDAVLPGLKLAAPSTDPDDVKRQEKLDRMKAALGTPDAITLATVYASLREEQDTAKAALAHVNLRLSAVEQLLIESQQAHAPKWGQYGVSANALRLASGDIIRVDREPQGKVIDKEMFRLWCIDHGYERQLQMWPSRMNLLCKERLLAGDPEPDGCDISTYLKLVYTPKKEK